MFRVALFMLNVWDRTGVLSPIAMVTVPEAANVQASVSLWETTTLVATVASAVFTSVSALLGLVAFYRRKRPHTRTLIRLDQKIGLERSSLGLAIFASTCALAGAFCSIRYTTVNRQQQHLADLENLQVHEQLAEARRQSASASQTANAAASELEKTKEQLARTDRDLADSYQQLAKAKERLGQVEAQVRWRSLNPHQRKRMVVILSRWKGGFVTFNPIAGDPEIHSFASDIRSGFEESGWRTGWTEFMELSETDAPPTEGVLLELPSVLKDQDLGRDLIKAAQIVDAAAEVRYLSGDQPTARVIHVVVGKKHAPKVRPGAPRP